MFGECHAHMIMDGVNYKKAVAQHKDKVVDAVIQIVRSEEKPDGFHYGGVFIGMTDTDALKIDIYQIFNEL